jgi:hypothetical protein
LPFFSFLFFSFLLEQSQSHNLTRLLRPAMQPTAGLLTVTLAARQNVVIIWSGMQYDLYSRLNLIGLKSSYILCIAYSAG